MRAELAPAPAPAGVVVWFTGLPASGKTTLAERIRERMAGAGRASVVLDSDALRPVVAPGLGYGPADRHAFYQRLARLAALLGEQGLVVLVAATAPARAHREAARGRVVDSGSRFIEVYMRAPREVCEERDSKGLYAMARVGDAPELPGIGADYQVPRHADVVADGGHDRAAADKITQLVSQGG